MEVSHIHEFKPHPVWPTHAVCAICGMSMPKDLIGAALEAGAKLTPEMRLWLTEMGDPAIKKEWRK